MMLALCTIVTFLRPVATACSKANSSSRRLPGAGVDAGGHGHRVRVVVDLHVVLVADVQPFEVLAHHHQVDVVEAAARNDGARRPQVGVELELLAQAHVRRSVAAARGRFERALERQSGAADAVERGLRQRIAGRLDAFEAGDLAVPRRRARSSASSAASVASTISGPMPSPGIRVAGMVVVTGRVARSVAAAAGRAAAAARPAGRCPESAGRWAPDRTSAPS